MAGHDGFHHHRARVNGLQLHYVREGERTGKPPLLLLHGWPGFYYEWRLNIGPLSERFDVVAPDMRGYGHSEKPDLPPEVGYTDTVFARDIAALLDHLGWERANIVAHDFGSVWTQTFARRYPDRVEKLVLFDPVYPGVGMRFLLPHNLREYWYIFFHQAPFAEAFVASLPGGPIRYVAHFLRHWSYDPNIWTREELEEYARVYAQPGALRGGFNCYRAALRTASRMFGLGLRLRRNSAPPSDARIPKIEAPTLVLWAEHDPVVPFEYSDRLGRYFRNCTLKRVERCGHFMMRERPERVNREIVEFVPGSQPP